MTARDYSILEKFKFERPAVGVKFLFHKPDGIQPLKKTLAFCEMFVEAQKGEPFYAAREHHECAGLLPLGMIDVDPIIKAGAVGERLGAYGEARTGARLYALQPKLERGTVNYVAFSPLDKLFFDPDVLIITATIEQAEVILRAASYTSGKPWHSQSTHTLGCAWLYVHPFLTGEINHMIAGLYSSGMVARRVLPSGLVIISVPFDKLSELLENLQNMRWVPEEYEIGRDGANEYFQRIGKEVHM
jgi:uncharacterized protein (DUF169 family)